jgi:predicted dehydrogenase
LSDEGANVPIRWGVAGPGGIAVRFANAMQYCPDGRITAVASRSRERADAFGDRFDVPTRYGDYVGLAEDPEVDAVYIATPHSRHETDATVYLAAGKHVLCEKPFALDASQVRRMIAAAQASGRFCMEAMWSRFLPAYRALADLLDAGRIGNPLFAEADFGFRRPMDPTHRLFDPALGGGALLDLGIYPLQLADLVFGRPDRIVADAILGETGVDEQVAAILHHPAGGLAVVKAATRVTLACTARIAGTDGTIDLPAFMHHPDEVRVTSSRGAAAEVIDTRFDGDGLRFEIDEVHRCVMEGLTESPTWPLAKTLELAETMDTIRDQIGVTYPNEDR